MNPLFAPNIPHSPVPDSPEASGGTPLSEMSWAQLVERVHQNDQKGLEELYRIFSKGIRFFLCRQLGPQDLDDKVHDVFLIIAQAIQRGELREPERLMGYVRTVVWRLVAAHIESAVHTRRSLSDIDSGAPLADRSANPEQIAIRREHESIAKKMLNSVSKRDREILIRFYLQEQSQDEICRDMRLTGTQFRLIKSRAKARFGELGRQRIARRNILRW
jgi:RNA polymerase sigma-70 factor, ECF subfamily